MKNKGKAQLYRVNFKLRRRGEAALDQNRYELASEDFDDDGEFCLAVASELLEIIKSDREAINEQDSDEGDS